MNLRIVLYAVLRLTPRMAAYQLKRLARNKLVPRIATCYERWIRYAARRLPPPIDPAAIPLELAEFIGSFYEAADEELQAAAQGRFTILGRTVEFGSVEDIDWFYRLPEDGDIHLWRMKLAQLELLHSLIASGDSAYHKTALALVESFAKSRSFARRDAFNVIWSPYGVSHRLLAVLSGLSIAVCNGRIAPDAREALEEFARLDAAFLWRNIEHDLRNNHTERNLAALCLYSLATEVKSRKRIRALDREVRRIIRATLLADGMQVERSAMYQGLTVMSLRLFAECRFLSIKTRQMAAEGARAASAAWLFLAHEDGEISLFNDSWIGEVPPPGDILDTDAIAVLRSLPAAGYFRLESGHVVALLDAGQIGPRWNPGHGHADFMALEVDVRGHRLIVDPGTSQYSTGGRRSHERSAASHNGPRYLGVEPVEFADSFKVGKLASADPLQPKEISRLSVAAIGGRLMTPLGSCVRVVCALPSGGLLVVDQWESPEPVGITSVLVPGTWSLNMSRGDPQEVVARFAHCETTLKAYQGRIDMKHSGAWSCRYLYTEQAHTIDFHAECDPMGGQRLVFGIGVKEVSEVDPIRAEAEILFKDC